MPHKVRTFQATLARTAHSEPSRHRVTTDVSLGALCVPSPPHVARGRIPSTVNPKPADVRVPCWAAQSLTGDGHVSRNPVEGRILGDPVDRHLTGTSLACVKLQRPLHTKRVQATTESAVHRSQVIPLRANEGAGRDSAGVQCPSSAPRFRSGEPQNAHEVIGADRLTKRRKAREAELPDLAIASATLGLRPGV